MKIIRNGVEIELTQEELTEAYDEKNIAYIKQDIAEIYHDEFETDSNELYDDAGAEDGMDNMVTFTGKDFTKMAESYLRTESQAIAYYDQIIGVIENYLRDLSDDDPRTTYKVKYNIRNSEDDREVCNTVQGHNLCDLKRGVTTLIRSEVKADITYYLKVEISKNGVYYNNYEQHFTGGNPESVNI